jgi:hypothetical protein
MRYLAPAVPLSIVLLATLTCRCSSGRNAIEVPEAGVDSAGDAAGEGGTNDGAAADGGVPNDAADAGPLDASEGG